MSTINLPVFAKSTTEMLSKLEQQRVHAYDNARNIIAMCVRKAILPKMEMKFIALRGAMNGATIGVHQSLEFVRVNVKETEFHVIFGAENTKVVGPGYYMEIPNKDLENID